MSRNLRLGVIITTILVPGYPISHASMGCDHGDVQEMQTQADIILVGRIRAVSHVGCQRPDGTVVYCGEFMGGGWHLSAVEIDFEVTEAIHGTAGSFARIYGVESVVSDPGCNEERYQLHRRAIVFLQYREGRLHLFDGGYGIIYTSRRELRKWRKAVRMRERSAGTSTTPSDEK